MINLYFIDSLTPTISRLYLVSMHTTETGPRVANVFSHRDPSEDCIEKEISKNANFYDTYRCPYAM